MTWPHSSKPNCYHIYGHIHNDTDLVFWPLLASYDHALNAGVDVNGFQPVTVREMILNRQRFLAKSSEINWESPQGDEVW